MRHSSIVGLILGLLLVPGVRADGDADPVPKDIAIRGQTQREISVARLRAHVKTLASDAYGGRESGTYHGRMTARYVAADFAKSGLQKMGTDGWMQKFPLREGLKMMAEGNRLKVRRGDEWVAARPERDFGPLAMASDRTAKGALVFVGYGIHAPRDQAYDDFAGVDLKGKVALIMRREPENGRAFLGSVLSRHAYFRTKVLEAQRRGAVAVILVSKPSQTIGTEDPLAICEGERISDCYIPVVHAKLDLIQKWVGDALDLEATQAEIDRTLRPASKALGIEVEVGAAQGYGQIDALNVIGYIRGSSPILREELVVIGAHHDHLGRGKFGSLGGLRAVGRIHNGADDNASGTAALMEIARSLAKTAKTHRPRRSVLFISFGGEERGLLGSKWWVDNPTIGGAARCVAMINLDMVGRGPTGRFVVSGVGTSPSWPPMLESLRSELGGQVLKSWPGQAPSDSTSFYNARVPVLFFFSGLHNEYHTPADDWHTLNYKQTERISQYVVSVVWELAWRGKTRPAFTDRRGPPVVPRGRPYLGVGQGDPRIRGYAVRYVVAGGSAARAGVLVGDVIVQMGDVPVTSLADLDVALRKYKVGQTVALHVIRGSERLTLKMTLRRR